LNADAAAVDDTEFIDAGLATLIDVLFDDARNIFGRKGMEIDSVPYRKDNRLVKLRVGRLRNGTTVGSVSLSHRIHSMFCTEIDPRASRRFAAWIWHRFNAKACPPKLN